MNLIFQEDLYDKEILVAKKDKKYKVQNTQSKNGKVYFSFMSEDKKETYVYKCDKANFKIEY